MICLADMSDNRHEILQSTQITDPERRRRLPPHPADPGCHHEGLLRGIFAHTPRRQPPAAERRLWTSAHDRLRRGLRPKWAAHGSLAGLQGSATAATVKANIY